MIYIKLNRQNKIENLCMHDKGKGWFNSLSTNPRVTVEADNVKALKLASTLDSYHAWWLFKRLSPTAFIGRGEFS